MENINVEKSDFNKILNIVKVLINDIEQVFSQDEIVIKRINDIKSGRIKGKTEKDYNDNKFSI